MSWYSEGAQNAEKLVASAQTKRSRNFFTRPGETAAIRFLSPASDSFNYKRAFVKWAKGDKLYTSPGTLPDPFITAGLTLQAAFAWLVIDRRELEFQDRTSGETRKIGPRVLFFADGQRTRKQLLAFEKEMLIEHNEELEEEGKPPVTLDQFNLTHYDLKASKEKGAPWNFVARKPKTLSGADLDLIEKHSFELVTELAPLDSAAIKVLLGSAPSNGSDGEDEEETIAYSYDSEDTIKFN